MYGCTIRTAVTLTVAVTNATNVTNGSGNASWPCALILDGNQSAALKTAGADGGDGRDLTWLFILLAVLAALCFALLAWRFARRSEQKKPLLFDAGGGLSFSEPHGL